MTWLSFLELGRWLAPTPTYLTLIGPVAVKESARDGGTSGRLIAEGTRNEPNDD